MTAEADPPQSLDHSLVSGIAWTAGWRWGGQLVSWIATLYAARHLVPGDYGLVNMALVGVGMARMIQDFGLDAILVQDRTIVGDLQDRLSGLIVMFGVALWALFAAAAEPVAWFFKEPRVAILVIVVGAVFVTDALQVVPRALMQRRLEYARLAWTGFVQLAATQLALVIAVRAGAGYWALVISTLAGEIVVTFVLIYLSPYRVAWPRGLRTLAGPLLQGWRLLASRAAWYGYSSSDQVIVGRLLGKDALGIYSFATTFGTLAQTEVSAVIARVVPGILSRVQYQPQELRRYFLLVTEFLVILSFPLSFGLALTADLVMPLVLGPNWGAIVVPLQLISLYSAFLSARTMVSHVLLWTGQFRVHMWCGILTGVTMPLALLGAARFGLVGLGWAWVLVFPLVNIPPMIFAFRTARVSVWDWLVALKPAAASCLFMAVCVLAVRTLIPPTLELLPAAAIAVGVGAAAYAGMLWFGFRARVRVMVEVASAIRSAA
jgi:O-antigen/teichoic acid export membrane protein